ncbi:right-handed parallel beta-helix repeat-containing protein [Nocardioides terrisoli]|uniref:right-handed parallel beta-helix repeat-containing protein n=1 Tax=Nocardioides terrisoli TaxID=3388267 RepID=UPI00287B7A42|nr:right-handed parallel beta-helix repeat-containing protein [Nocardioides marmorisolisilvae]
MPTTHPWRRALATAVALATTGATGLALAGIAVPSAAAAAPTTRYVAPSGSNTTNECTDGAAPCQTIQYAVDHADPGDTISIGPGTYPENVQIDVSLTLSGTGANTTISGNGSAAPSISVDGTGSATPPFVALTGLDVSDNHDSGSPASVGISLESATARITDSTVSANDSHGVHIDKGSSATITSSTVSGNEAAGVYVGGGSIATITDSTVSNNAAAGIFLVPDSANPPKATVHSSTINGNGQGGVVVDTGHADIDTTTLDGNAFAGLMLSGDGASASLHSSTVSHTKAISGQAPTLGAGVVVYLKASVSIANSTIDANTGQGILNSSGTVTVEDSTIADTEPGQNENGFSDGAVVVNTESGPATTNLSGTILARNPYMRACNGIVADKGFNLASDTSCSLDAGGSLNNTAAKLGMLADNGGPTKTMAPEAVSRAVNAIPNGVAPCTAGAKDQRGLTRPQGLRCDIGAVELAARATPHLALAKTTIGYGHQARARVSVPGAGTGTVTVRTSGFRHTAALSGGAATVRLPAGLSVGPHTVTATYDGTTRIISSAPAQAALRVVKQKTRTTVKLAKKSVKAGRTATLHVRVRGHAGGAFPAGQVRVTLKVGHHKVTRKATLHKRDKGALRVKVKTPRHRGSARVVVHYSGDHHYTKSTSKPQTVQLR